MDGGWDEGVHIYIYTWCYKVATVSQIFMTWVPWESSRIAGVILVILLLFGLCMASSLGLGSEGVGGLMLKNGKPDKAEVCVIPWYTNRICLLFCEIWLASILAARGSSSQEEVVFSLSYWVTAEFFRVLLLVLWRLSISDWLIALALGTGLMLLQLYAFYHTGCLGSGVSMSDPWSQRRHRQPRLMAVPAGDFAFPLMAGS